ncbi:hypothetical protein PIB30_014260 [Stylosanthes scabra]|uniref:Uncharacterized protein n=1 Tax=Stylosanthes scabra TaxID=79078 RepID=A0ABU6Y539_9FABA|nr:hypothetical protein [Stylosanthes scabra]
MEKGRQTKGFNGQEDNKFNLKSRTRIRTRRNQVKKLKRGQGDGAATEEATGDERRRKERRQKEHRSLGVDGGTRYRRLGPTEGGTTDDTGTPTAD